MNDTPVKLFFDKLAGYDRLNRWITEADSKLDDAVLCQPPLVTRCVPRQDLPKILDDLWCEAPTNFPCYCVKPRASRLSRGVALLAPVHPRSWRIAPGAFARTSKELQRFLMKSALPDVPDHFVVQEAVTPLRVHECLEFAMRTPLWGPPVFRFIVHRGRITVVVLIHALAQHRGLAGALSLGQPQYSYFTQYGGRCTPEEVLSCWDGYHLNNQIYKNIAHKRYFKGPTPDRLPEIFRLVRTMERVILPHVEPHNEGGRYIPWSIDGVLEPSRFAILELNHKPGHEVTRVVK